MPETSGRSPDSRSPGQSLRQKGPAAQTSTPLFEELGANCLRATWAGTCTGSIGAEQGILLGTGLAGLGSAWKKRRQQN